MNLLLLTTCIYNEENIRDLDRLLKSIESQDDKDISVYHYILFQNINNIEYLNITSLLDRYQSKNYTLEFLEISNIVSLSKARNILIEYYQRNQSSHNTIDFVSFPDDDCWYLPNLVGKLTKIYELHKPKIIYTKFSSSPFDNNKFSLNSNCQSLISNASSNTAFYAYDLFTSIGEFDERFGVGTKNNGGEDTDYAIRGYLLSGKKIIYIDSEIIGHRDPLPEFRYKYFQGSFGVIGKHKFKSLNIMLCYIRKLIVGVVFFSMGKINLSSFKTNE
jgi:hypothetical protein